jgi:hypothetical protein
MQKISQIHQQAAKVEEAPSRFHVDLSGLASPRATDPKTRMFSAPC